MNKIKMNFDRIPVCISDGHVNTSTISFSRVCRNDDVDIPGWLGEDYCDTELDDIYLEPPMEGKKWIVGTQKEQLLDTLCESNVKFTKYRWTREKEIIEYWTGEHELGQDMFFAHQNESNFTVIFCLNGHPGIITPTVSWDNSDGSTDAPDIKFDTVERLIEQIYPIGIDFVKNQQH